MRLIWPWQDGSRGFSWLKASALALMFMPALWMLYQYGTGQFGYVPLAAMTYWSGVWATAILLLALAVTPASRIFRWNQLIIARRMIGVTALIYTIAHMIIYFGLRLWNFPSIANEMVTRLTLIVASVSTVGLVVLGATSLDAAVLRMGVRSWQRLHNVVYVTSGLAVLHYLLSPGVFPDQYLMSGVFFWLLIWRLLDRRGLGADPTALATLAVVSSLFTALFEAGWIWAYHGFEPLGTLGDNFSLDLGLPPPWQVLGLGLLIALAARYRTRPALRKSAG